MEREKLEKLKKSELEVLCKEKGIITKGKKSDLIKRLCCSGVFDRIKNINYTLYLQSPQRYLYTNLGFLFNNNTNAVIGKMNEYNETIYLTKDDIEICKELGFRYEIPPILNGTTINKKCKRIEDDIFSDDEEEE